MQSNNACNAIAPHVMSLNAPHGTLHSPALIDAVQSTKVLPRRHSTGKYSDAGSLASLAAQDRIATLFL